MNALVPTTNAEVYRASTDAASLCREIVVKTAQAIQGRKYVKVEGWQAIAVAHGCAAGARDVERIDGGVRAVGEVRRMSDGQVIATAEGFVGEDEPTWFGGKAGNKMLPKRADYAIRAMAQTRAISRACRSAFAHVVVLIDAGLSTTPAEEVPVGGFDDEPVAFAGIERSKPTGRQKTDSQAHLKRDGVFEIMEAEIAACKSFDELDAWNAKRAPDIGKLPVDWRNALEDRFRLREETLSDAAKEAATSGEAMDAEFSAAVG